MNTWNRFWWVSLLLGSMIYILFRSESLLYNRLLGSLFHPIATPKTAIEQLIVYSLPDGLWAMSYTMLILHIRKNTKITTLIWASIIPLLGIISEIAQYFFILPGTFDIFDLSMYIVLPITVISYSK